MFLQEIFLVKKNIREFVKYGGVEKVLILLQNTTNRCMKVTEDERMFLFCFVLFCFVLFCFVLFCFVLFCFVLFCFVLFCFVLFCFVLFCFVLFCFVLFCVVLCPPCLKLTFFSVGIYTRLSTISNILTRTLSTISPVDVSGTAKVL